MDVIGDHITSPTSAHQADVPLSLSRHCHSNLFSLLLFCCSWENCRYCSKCSIKSTRVLNILLYFSHVLVYMCVCIYNIYSECPLGTKASYGISVRLVYKSIIQNIIHNHFNFFKFKTFYWNYNKLYIVKN